MSEDSPELMTDTKLQIQKAERTPSRINSKLFYNQAYHIQIIENQSPREALKQANKSRGESEGNIKSYLQKNKDNNLSDVLKPETTRARKE